MSGLPAPRIDRPQFVDFGLNNTVTDWRACFPQKQVRALAAHALSHPPSQVSTCRETINVSRFYVLSNFSMRAQEVDLLHGYFGYLGTNFVAEEFKKSVIDVRHLSIIRMLHRVIRGV